VVQVEGTSTWVVVTENNRGYISCGSVKVEGTSTWLIQREQGRVHPLWIFAFKGFYKVEKKSQGPQVAWGLDVGTGCCQTSTKLLCLSSSSLHYLISDVHFNYRFYFWLSFFSTLHFLNNIVKA